MTRCAACEVPGEHAGGQAELGVVGAGDHLVLVVERQHGHHRPEDLLAHDRHVVGAAVEHRRRDEAAVGERAVGRRARRRISSLAPSPRPARCSRAPCPLLLRRSARRPGSRVERVADRHRSPRGRRAVRRNAVLHRAVHEDARAVRADLARPSRSCRASRPTRRCRGRRRRRRSAATCRRAPASRASASRAASAITAACRCRPRR